MSAIVIVSGIGTVLKAHSRKPLIFTLWPEEMLRFPKAQREGKKSPLASEIPERYFASNHLKTH